MRIHRKATLALLTAVIGFGCGTSQDIESTGRSNAYGCDSCHGYPPPPYFPSAEVKTHPRGVTGAECHLCHPGTVLADGHTIVAGGEHRDGQIEVRPFAELSCTDCHATPPPTGRHVFHVQTRGLACATCHRGFDPEAKTADADVHMNGRADVILQDGTVIETANRADHSWTDQECATCHAAIAND
jgi:hypothetical protein